MLRIQLACHENVIPLPRMKHINFITWNFCKHLCIITGNIRVQITQVIILFSNLTIGMVVKCKTYRDRAMCHILKLRYSGSKILLSYKTRCSILRGICFQSYCRPCDHVSKVVLGNDDVLWSHMPDIAMHTLPRYRHEKASSRVTVMTFPNHNGRCTIHICARLCYGGDLSNESKIWF